MQSENVFTINPFINMSKDKGHKNNKKAPADKTDGKTKVLSAYQREKLNLPPEIMMPKIDTDKIIKKK